jgi:hypothetical protein
MMCGGGDWMRWAQRNHARWAPSILAEAEKRLWWGKSEGGVGLANQFGFIVLFQNPRPPTVRIPRGSLNRYHHESPLELPLRPFSNHYNPRRTSSSPMESHHRRAHLYRRSCSPREFTFRVFSFITKATPRFALIHWIFLMPAIPLPEYRR